MRWLFLILFGAALTVWAQEKFMNEYIITETGQPTSLDPLDADQTQNLPVARMIYATPLEIDATDSIKSLVLETFSYDKKSRTITWLVKSNLKYADGQNLTAQDIAFAVARMSLVRPQFPVIELIEGLNEWIKQPEPLKTLPKGIVVDDRKVTIRLSKDTPHPLFRFCLELFSIIPKSCVDLKTNKISCSKIPESGRYTISAQDSSQIGFSRRLGDSSPEKVTFRYVQAKSLEKELTKISKDAVIAGNESMFSGEELKKFSEGVSFYYLPAARFSVLQISPKLEPFQDKVCRVVLANEFRKQYVKITGEYSPAESSIFPKILPGYMKRADLEAPFFARLKKSEIDQCVTKLRMNELAWGFVETEKNSAFVRAFTAMMKSLELKGEPKIFKDRRELAEAFVSGKISTFNAGSGFWANDPVGDLQMLFTPHLHKPLVFLSEDSTLQKLIQDLVKDQGENSKYQAVNQYLHDQGLFNVYTHVRRFYFSKNKDRLKQIPQGTAAPHPWQVFE